MDNFKTKVIFRKWRDGDVIAFFPEIPSDSRNWYNCLSYMHIGQHGGADYTGLLSVTTPATKEEYTDLHNELTNYVGYNLEVYHKESDKMREIRRAEWNRVRN